MKRIATLCILMLLAATLLPAMLYATDRTGIVPQANPYVVQLAWDAPAIGPVPDGYRIYRADTAGGPYTRIGEVAHSATPTWTSPEQPNGTFYYVVSAFNSVAESGYSNEVSETFANPPHPPANLRKQVADFLLYIARLIEADLAAEAVKK